MGNQCLCAGRHPSNVLFLGLDGAGKTSVLYWLKYGTAESVIPTIGFNVETVQPVKNVSFTVWDVHGGDKARPVWSRYFTGCDGLVFVVDGSNESRFNEAREELNWVLKSDEVVGMPLVLLVNKQDNPRAVKPSDMVMKLGLERAKAGRKVHIQGTSAVTGEGICEAMKELSVMIKGSR